MRERGRFFCVCEVKPRKFGNLSLISTMDRESDVIWWLLCYPTYLSVKLGKTLLKWVFFRKMVGFACKSMDWKGRRKVDMFVLLSYWLDLPAGREYLGFFFFFFPEGFGWSEVSSVATVREFYQLLLLIGLKLGVYILSLTKKASLRASSSPANILRK